MQLVVLKNRNGVSGRWIGKYCMCVFEYSIDIVLIVYFFIIFNIAKDLEWPFGYKSLSVKKKKINI